MPDDRGESGISSIEFTRRSTLLGIGGLATGAGIFGKNTERMNSEISQSNSSHTRKQGELSASIDEVLPGDKFGKIRIGQYPHSLQVSGTRRPAWMVQPFSEDVHTTNTTYEEVGSNVGYGVIPFPPGQVPILRIVGHFDNHPRSTTSLRVSIANKPMYSPQGTPQPLDDGEVKQTILEVTGKGETQVYDEAYLSDYDDIVTGMPNGSPLPTNTFIIEMKTDDSTHEATISNASTVSLELEAL
jgi:hypothetical protein